MQVLRVMKKFFILLIAVCAWTGLCQAEPVNKQINIASFDRIDASSIFNIEVTHGSSRTAEVTVSDKLENYIEVYVTNGTLYLRMDLPLRMKHLLLSEDKVQVCVQTKKLTSIALAGSAKISVEGAYEADRFALDLSGTSEVLGALRIEGERLDYELSGASAAAVAGDFEVVRGKVSGTSSMALTVDADEVDVDCSGASHVVFEGEVSERVNVDCSGASLAELTGSTREIIIECSGASTVEAAKLYAQDGTADVSGVSSVKIYGSNSLNLKCSSNAKVKYYGNPKELSYPEGAVQQGN